MALVSSTTRDLSPRPFATQHGGVKVNYVGKAPAIVRWYANWLVGEQNAGTSVCRCRATARQAL
ncbi:hypothetical protein BD413DRAFT_565465 [Trametes elegans]|nr:hypothetical protein BD413DRAFT_565465 [Trametes elegans]